MPIENRLSGADEVTARNAGPSTLRQPPRSLRTQATNTRPPEAQQSQAVSSDLFRRIGQLEDQLKLLRTQVRQAQQLAGLGVMAATIAHEVNNLLTPILGYAESALKDDRQDLKQKALEVTVKNVRLLVAMAERVLGISAATQTAPRKTRVCDAVRNAIDSLCRDLSKDGIRVVTAIDESATVLADPLHLQQILFNLFINARTAMAALHNGRLRIEANQEGDTVVIRVEDSGSGIPPEMLPHIFEPLQSSKLGDPSATRRCTGLGLALCRDLVQENSGTIEVSSRPGAGATFTIRLPVARSPASIRDAPAQEDRSDEVASTGSPGSSF